MSTIKRKMVGLFASAGCLFAPSALAQSTAFTYQGELESSGTPASGLHDFRFSLFDAAGTQVGSQLCADNVQVVEGKFTTPLDFGAAFATTAGRFLEIEVRQNTGLNCGSADGFVMLTPRQPITPAPRATAASVANALAAPDGSPASAVFVNNSGNVGVGTQAPSVPLHISRDIDPVLVIQDSGPNSTQAGYVGFWNSSGAETGWMGFGSPTSPSLSIVNERAFGNIQLFPGPSGETVVRGNVRLGNSGELFAPAAGENLRMIRGSVRGDGSIQAGQGFSVTHSTAGVYGIEFTHTFSGPATVVASVTDTFPAPIRLAGVCTTCPNLHARSIIRTFTLNQVDTDTDFTFIAVGPR